MKLTPDQRQKLIDAMIDVFPDHDALDTFLYRKFALKLNRLAGDSADLQTAVIRVVQRFEPENKHETAIERLVAVLAMEFDANKTLGRLQKELNLVPNKQQHNPDASMTYEFLPEQTQTMHPEDVTIGAGNRQQTRPKAAPRKVRTSNRQTNARDASASSPDKIALSRRRLAEMETAVRTLDDLVTELEHALASFVASHADGVARDLQADATADDAFARVNELYQEIMDGDHESVQAVDELLRVLLVDVIEGIRISEKTRSYDVVSKLCRAAADSCKRVADLSYAGEEMVLTRVVPYWKMRETYARYRAELARELTRQL